MPDVTPPLPQPPEENIQRSWRAPFRSAFTLFYLVIVGGRPAALAARLMEHEAVEGADVRALLENPSLHASQAA